MLQSPYLNPHYLPSTRLIVDSAAENSIKPQQKRQKTRENDHPENAKKETVTDAGLGELEDVRYSGALATV